MKVTFSGQPFPNHNPLGRVGDVLKAWLEDQQTQHVEFASAWVKRSGLARIATYLKGFRQNGGSSSIVIGIDEGGATRQGMELALELFDDVYVYHDNSWRTFHPKVYYAGRQGEARAIIGSANVTAGGLYSNFEAFTNFELDLGVQEDLVLAQQIKDWFATLKTDSGRSVKLSDTVLAELVGDAAYRIADEGVKSGGSSQSTTSEDEATESDTIVGPKPSGLFGGGISLLPGAPSIAGTGSPAPSVSVPGTPTSGHSGTNVPSPTPIQAGTTATWSKLLSPSDAQRPPSNNTSPTGRLTLTKSGHDIDHTTYFRNDFFRELSWATETRREDTFEVATVTMDVFIGGSARGQVQFGIDHAAHRVSGQGNVATWLHWSSLNQALTNEFDATGWRVTLTKLQDGSFRMDLNPNGSI